MASDLVGPLDTQPSQNAVGYEAANPTSRRLQLEELQQGYLPTEAIAKDPQLAQASQARVAAAAQPAAELRQLRVESLKTNVIQAADVQTRLVGSNFSTLGGDTPVLNDVSGSTTSDHSTSADEYGLAPDQARFELISTGSGLSQWLLPKPANSAGNAVSHNSTSGPQLLINSNSLYMVCLVDGTSARSSSSESSLAEGEEGDYYDGGIYGDGNYEDGNYDNGVDSNSPGLKLELAEIDWPQLEFALFQGSLDDFLPADTSNSSTVSVGGNFDQDSLANPDYSATGVNSVHTVNRQWLGETQWSFSETLFAVFNITDSDSLSGQFPEAGSTAPEDSNFDVTGSWSASAAAIRSGYVLLTFHASRGMTTASAAGVAWSMSIGYRDALTISGNTSGNATITASEESAGNAGTGNDAWASSFTATGHSGGSLSISSTPTWVSSVEGVVQVDRAIVANGTYDVGGNDQADSNWSSRSQSGNLTKTECLTCSATGETGLPADGVLPGGLQTGAVPTASDIGVAVAGSADGQGDPVIDNPLGKFDGRGHTAGGSGASGATSVGSMLGAWNMQGTRRGQEWLSMAGRATAHAQSNSDDSDQDNDLFFWQDQAQVGETAYPSVTNGWSGLYSYGWAATGAQHGNLTASVDTLLALDAAGQLELSTAEDVATMTANLSGGGYDFLQLDFSEYDSFDGEIMPGTPFLDDRHTSNFSRLMVTTVDTASAGGQLTVDADAAPATAASSSGQLANTWSGNGFQLLIWIGNSSDGFDIVYPADENGYGGYSNHSLQKDSEIDVLVLVGNDQGDLTTSVAGGAAEASGSGTAGTSVRGEVSYRSRHDFEIKNVNLDPSNPTQDRTDKRDADFSGILTFGASFDGATGQVTLTPSSGGNAQVTITATSSDPDTQLLLLQRTAHEMALEQMFGAPADEAPSSPTLPEDNVYPANPNASDGSWFSWFGGRSGDATDQVFGYTKVGSDVAVVVGSIVAEPIDWYLTGQEIWNEPTSYASYIGLIPFVPSAAGKALKKSDEIVGAIASKVPLKGPSKFDVGPYDQLKGTVPGLDAHHAGQSAAMKKVISGYDHGTAPTILVPKVGHTIKGPNGIVSRSTEGLDNARDILARDINELRRVYPDVPNSKLQELIDMNKRLYPEIAE